MHRTVIRDRRRNRHKSDADRDAFLAVVSHELRNQINSILGWAVLMRRPVTDGETLARGLTVIERNAHLQAKLIEQLIDLSCVRINCLKPKTQKSLLAPILETSLDSMMPLAREKGIEMVARLEDSKHAVNVDPGLLQQAITNILGNAIKFTPAGGRIELQLVTLGTWAEIAVSDTGCGIPRELLHVIFDPFKQLHTNQANHEGLGLGLTIAHHIIAAHKGTIRANSPGEGRGTTFIVTLPLENSDSAG
jgi:two-component system, chemotaxis family, CheB/CheR fusion protein